MRRMACSYVNPARANWRRFIFEFISKEMSFEEVTYEKKKLVMNSLLQVSKCDPSGGNWPNLPPTIVTPGTFCVQN